MDLVERDQNVDLGADAFRLGAAQHVLGGGEVLDREPKRLEDRQLGVVAAAFDRAVEQLADLAADALRPDRAVRGREEVVARFVQGRLAPVDVERGGAHRGAVELRAST